MLPFLRFVYELWGQCASTECETIRLYKNTFKIGSKPEVNDSFRMMKFKLANQCHITISTENSKSSMNHVAFLSFSSTVICFPIVFAGKGMPYYAIDP